MGGKEIVVFKINMRFHQDHPNTSLNCKKITKSDWWPPLKFSNLLISLFLFLNLAVLVLIVVPSAVRGQALDPGVAGYEKVKPPARPVIKIVSPQKDSSVLGPKVTLEYVVSGVKLIDPKEEKPSVRGEGHLKILFAREGYAPPEPIYLSKKSPLPFENIPEGKYSITLEVVKNSGRSYDPPVQDITKFAVLSPATPTPTFTPTLTPTPVPLWERIPINRQQALLFLGIVLLIAPTVYLFLRTRL